MANELIFWNLLNPLSIGGSAPHFGGPTSVAATGNGIVFQYTGLENKLYCWFWKTVKDLYKRTTQSK